MNARKLSPADLTARRVLVVAPHPDDETLGCGGLIWHLVRLGREVHVVFVTDGGASHLNSPSWSRQRLATQREEEASEALRGLDADNASRTFMRLLDAAMPRQGKPDHERALKQAIRIINALRPDLVVLPWRRDPHCDHRDAWALFQTALTGLSAKPEVWEYAIWLDELGTVDDRPREEEMERILFDIGEALPAKLRAVQAHRTQLGALINDDPSGFSLTKSTIDRLVGPSETYWRPRR